MFALLVEEIYGILSQYVNRNMQTKRSKMTMSNLRC